MNGTSYYIGTGAKNNYFTLRYRFDEQVVVSRDPVTGHAETISVTRDFHVRNLSIDRDQAVAKAREITGLGLTADFEVLPIGERADANFDWSIFHAGKYSGKSIHEVAQIDKQYLVWACENLGNSDRYAKTVELAKALVAHELAAKASEKAAAEAKRADLGKTFAPIADALADGRNGFCDNVAVDLRRGILPSEKAIGIVCDILAKKAGRRGSKAYDAEYSKVLDIFDAK